MNESHQYAQSINLQHLPRGNLLGRKGFYTLQFPIYVHRSRRMSAVPSVQLVIVISHQCVGGKPVIEAKKRKALLGHSSIDRNDDEIQ
jgi:hypothetical protein